MSAGNVLSGKPDPLPKGRQKLSASWIRRILSSIHRQVSGDGRTIQTDRFGDRTVLRAPTQDRFGALPHVPVQYFAVYEESFDYLICAPFHFNWQEIEKPEGWQQGDPLPEIPPYIYDPYAYDDGPFPSPGQRQRIAKPFLLQKTAWDGQTVELAGVGVTLEYDPVVVGKRTATGVIMTDVTETQWITPAYAKGEVIAARPTVTALRDDPTNKPFITWTDINEAGRCWASECEE